MLQAIHFEFILASAVFFPFLVTSYFEDEVCTNENCTTTDDVSKRTSGGGDRGIGQRNRDEDLTCDPTICRGEGSCLIENGDAKCKCLEQYYIGKYCNVETDHCKYRGVFEECNPIGTEQCVAYFGGRYCKCRAGYLGTDCQDRAPLHDEYFFPAPSPMVYFLHENIEGGTYPLYVTIENVSDTVSMFLTISGRGGREIRTSDMKRNYKLSKFMALPNVPEKINQNYYFAYSYTFNTPGLFMVKLKARNFRHNVAWRTYYYFAGRTLKKSFEYGACPPKILLHGNTGVCFPNKLTDIWLPKLTEDVKYIIHYDLQPCQSPDENIQLSYFVTDLYDIHKIYQKIPRAFMIPPVRLNSTASIVIRAVGENGTSYAQCYVRFAKKRPSEPYSQPVYGPPVRDEMLIAEDYDPNDPINDDDDDDEDDAANAKTERPEIEAKP